MVLQKRDQVLSVKASAIEKQMVIEAAKMHGMTYSEFVRTVAVAAARSLGIEAPEVEDPEPAPKPRRKRRKARVQDDPRPEVVPV